MQRTLKQHRDEEHQKAFNEAKDIQEYKLKGILYKRVYGVKVKSKPDVWGWILFILFITLIVYSLFCLKKGAKIAESSPRTAYGETVCNNLNLVGSSRAGKAMAFRKCLGLYE